MKVRRFHELNPFTAALVVLCGFALPAMANWGAVRALSTIGYHSTEGVVVSSEIRSTDSLHEPIIQYEYVVQGQTNVGSMYTVVPLDKDGTREWAESVASVLMPGARCAVYYDPDAPENSVLRRKLRLNTVLVASGSAVLGLFCGLVGLIWLRGWFEHRRTARLEARY